MEQVEHLSQQPSGAPAPDGLSQAAESHGAPVTVTLWEAGQSRAVKAYEGESLMQALKRAGLGLLAVCGGKGACGTCKVAFPPQWASRLSPSEKRELRLLTHLKAGQGERLSCRIELTAALSGLEVHA